VLTCDERRSDRWRGSVLVKRELARTDADDRATGCWLEAGPFVLFGYPDFLAVWLGLWSNAWSGRQ
jgi:hypothetical protein